MNKKRKKRKIKSKIPNRKKKLKKEKRFCSNFFQKFDLNLPSHF